MRFSMIKLMTLAIMLSCSLSSFGQQVAVWNTEHYRERMAEFAKMRSIDATDIVMLGNSLTEFGGDWSKRLGLKHVRNRGIAGDNVDGVLNRLDAILSKKPKAILLMIGINDISQDQTAEQIFEKYQRLIDRIWAQAADTKLYVQSVLPINESFGRWKTLEGKTDVVPVLNVKLIFIASVTISRISICSRISFIMAPMKCVVRSRLTVSTLPPWAISCGLLELKRY